MKRTWKRGGVALGAAVVMLLAACGDDGGGGGGGPADWWHIQTGEQGPLTTVFPELLAEFNEANGTDINAEPIANDEFKPALTTAMQAGDPPDLFHSWGGGVLQQYVQAGLVRDITDDVADVIDNFSPGALQPYTIDGRIYGLPFDMGMVGMWYNKALFEQAGLDPDNPPASWSEFLAAVDTLQAEGITPIAVAGSAPWTQHYWFSYLAIRVMGIDGYVAAREAKSFDDPGFVQAAEMWKELVDKEPFQDGFLQMGYGGDDSSPQVFGLGGAAMHLMGQWDPTVVEDSAGTSLGDDLGWFPFPEVQGGAGSITDPYGGGNGHSVGINAPDEVVDFLKFLTVDSYDRLLEADSGLIPVTRDAQIPAEQVNQVRIYDTVANASAFQLYFDQDLPPAVGDQVNASVAAITDGSMTPEQAVQAMTDVFQNEPDFAVTE